MGKQKPDDQTVPLRETPRAYAAVVHVSTSKRVEARVEDGDDWPARLRAQLAETLALSFGIKDAEMFDMRWRFEGRPAPAGRLFYRTGRPDERIPDHMCFEAPVLVERVEGT